MLTIAEYTDGAFYARTINADATAGEIVIPGKATDEEIREYANENLCAPDCGSFDGFPVYWEAS